MFCPKCGTKNLEDSQFCENCGIKLTNTGNQPHTYSSEANKPSILVIILGYIFAILGGLIGIVIGLYLLSKDNSSAKFHGRNIMIIAVISIILGYLLTWSGF